MISTDKIDFIFEGLNDIYAISDLLCCCNDTCQLDSKTLSIIGYMIKTSTRKIKTELDNIHEEEIK